jgi:putative transposase
MPRRLRCNTGGYGHHVLNRAVGRTTLFQKDGDYAAFEKVLHQARDWQPMRRLAYALIPITGISWCLPKRMATCPSSSAG